MNNGNGFLAPALGIHLWQRLWGHKTVMTPMSRGSVGPISSRYYAQLDNMRWQDPPLTRVQVVAVLVTFVRDDTTGYANADRVTAVRQIFGTFTPGARVLSQVPEQHWPAIVRQVQELQS